jgi:hypothetical protein
MFVGYSYLGFSHRWLVRRQVDRYSRMSMQEIQLLKSVARFLASKELQNEQSGFLSPCIFLEKDLRLQQIGKTIVTDSRGKLGRQLQGPSGIVGKGLVKKCRICYERIS